MMTWKGAASDIAVRFSEDQQKGQQPPPIRADDPLDRVIAIDTMRSMAFKHTSDFENTGVQPAWGSRVVCPALGLRPRQFEYDPKVST
jgi:hypothetical protein